MHNPGSMRKAVVIGIMLLFVGIYILPATAHSVERSQLTSRGKWLYVGGSGPGNYSTIQDAIDDANDGEGIFVYDDSSPYLENVHINKQLMVIGEHRNTTVLVSQNTSDAVNITCSSVVFTGFTLQAEEGSINHVTLNQDNIVITDNVLINISIASSSSEGIVLSSNTFLHNKWFHGRLIQIGEGKNCIIQGNFVARCNSAIKLVNCKSCIVRGNTIHNCFSGIAISDGHSNVIVNNRLDTCGDGIFLMGGRAQVENNTIFESNNAIRLYHVRFAYLSTNILTNCLCGIHMDHALFCRITSNDFGQNSINTFVMNSLFNTWKQNFWGRPRLLPKLVITFFYKEVPGSWFGALIVPWLNVDFRPAVKPNCAPMCDGEDR
ncbi:MAG: hypothetical protein JXA00_01785 [Candidatus Thermoplasmatota archaeon]|nr:hypothetical protein [Candidatus Thermoplasmatota archaeon]